METEGNRTIAGLMYHPLAHMKARQGKFAGGTQPGFPMPGHPSGERRHVVLLGVRRDRVGHQDARR